MRFILGAFVLAAAIAIVAGCRTDLSLVEEAEGLRLCTYKDTMGIPTVCYGYNLHNGNARAEITSVGGDYDSVIKGGCLTQNQCSELLNKELANARSGAVKVFGNQCPCIEAVLVDMTYNLGEGGVASFTTLKSLIEKHEYAAAANDLKGTAYCRQVGHRCTRNTEILAAGCSS